MFVDLVGLDGARVDPASKSIETSVALPPGADRSFAFRVVAPRDAGGRVLGPQVSLQDFYAGASYIDSVATGIGTRPSTGGLVLGSHRITPAGLVALGFLLAILVLWVLGRVRSRRGPSTDRRGRPVPRILARGTGPLAGALAIVIALGFWTLFGSMARRDWRSLASPETTCTVLDRRLRIETATSGTGGSADDRVLRQAAGAALPGRRRGHDLHRLRHRVAPSDRRWRERAAGAFSAGRSAPPCRAGSIPKAPGTSWSCPASAARTSSPSSRSRSSCSAPVGGSSRATRADPRELTEGEHQWRGFRPRYITFDCYGTLTNFQMSQPHERAVRGSGGPGPHAGLHHGLQRVSLRRGAR